jgi:hypothetical protein
VASIVLHSGAKADFDDLWAKDPESAGVIYALLQEAKGNQRVLETFTSHDFGAYETDRYHVAAWAQQQRKGRNLWRLKIWQLEHHRVRYRIVYAFDPRKQRYFVLGILPRDFDYDETDARTRRVLEAYERLNIPRYD